MRVDALPAFARTTMSLCVLPARRDRLQSGDPSHVRTVWLAITLMIQAHAVSVLMG